MTRAVAISTARWRAGLVAAITSFAILMTIVGLAQPVHAAPSTSPIVPENVVAPLTNEQIVALANQVQKTLTPAERREVRQLLAEIQRAEKAPAGKGTDWFWVFPGLVAHVATLIIRFGIPWLIRYAQSLWNAFWFIWDMRVKVCETLRAFGNGWGWSWYCWGTY